jgi:hypothetical protein
MNKSNEMSPLTKKVIGGLNFLADKITNLNKSIENKAGRIPEICALIFYAILHCIITCYHEPWYDEAVAWQIAKCASLKDILLKIPHYEGHPQLWHLILVPFAKLGADYEITLLLISLIFTEITMALLLFKSPFPRMVRLLIPFTYYFFYQYGVITRPYCMMMLAFLLAAITYKKRNETPGIHVLSLAFLCLTSAYGILFAGCICIVWVIEILQEYIFTKKSGTKLNPLKDKRTLWLFGLLVMALLLIVMIIPADDALAVQSITTGTADAHSNGVLMKLAYMLFALPAETTCSTVFNEFTSLSGAESIDLGSLIGAEVAGIIILAFILAYGYIKGKTTLFLVPYLIYAIFCSTVYFYVHHIGVILLYSVFWFWIAKESKTLRKLSLRERDQKVLQSGAVIFGTILMLVSLVWSAVAAKNEIKYTYGAGRNEAEFISHYGLDNYNIMTEWEVRDDTEGEIATMDTNSFAFTDNIGPYTDHNIFYNFNFGDDELNYSTHIRPTEEEIEETLAQWKEKGYPDVLYQEPRLSAIWDEDELSYEDYAMVYLEPVNYIMKNELQVGWSKIYVRKDLLDELGLEEIDEPMFLTLTTYAKIVNPNMDYK